MAEAVLVALGKIGNVLADEATKGLLAKLSEKVSNLIDLDDKIEGIAKQLNTMKNVIQQIGTPYLADKVVKGWIGEVRKLAYHVEDVMDKYSYHSLHVEKGFLKKCLKGSHYVRVFSQIADEVVKIEKEIKQVIELKEQWLQPSQLVHDPHTEMERQRSQDSFPELVKDEDLIGIEDNRRMMTEWLYSDEMETTVITVSGMGGLGKTTLVTNVYEREKVNFQTSAWMVVSQTYTLDALLRKLLEKVTEQPSSPNIDRMDVHDLKEEIKRKLKDRKCLIVLDDVWNKEVYSQMRDAFQNSHASRIIITTRNNHVAAVAHLTRRIDLKPLGNAHAFELFCRRVFYIKKDHEYECPSHLMKTARSIVDRCQGLPLAILSIGGVLSSRPQTQYSWEQICNQLSTELSKNDHLRAVLNLSYHDLSGDLRNCLLYCSLFPEDYPMSRESLVRLWVAEGFVCSKGNSTPEEVAEGNLTELIYRNMLEVKETDELGRVSTCTMHDIVRDLVLCVASEEQFVCANDYATLIHMNKDVRRLSSCGWKGNTALKIKLPRLRTLVSVGAISSMPAMPFSVSSESSYLTVLELQDSEITEVPAWIGTLFNLRYIGLRRTKVRSLPDSVEKLSNLQTLDIKQTNIETLPRGIAKIKNLRHLLADRYADEKQTEFRYFVGIQAPKELPNIEGLQTLETIQANKDLAEQLERMVQLRTLWIDNISSAECANIFAALSNMPLLSSLLLAGRDENEALCFESLQPMSTHLHKLIIRGKWAKGTLDCPIFRSHGENLKYLALSWCHLWEDEDPLGMLAPHLPNLTYLRLNNMRSANILVLSADSFPHLKSLTLKHMHNVDELNIIDGALPCIEGLYVVSLSKLDKVPQGIECLSSLKKLWLLGLPGGFKAQWDLNGMQQKMVHVQEVRV
ncbi:disease resistance protein RPM1 [Aegilops tauschii subsp. strangulata]|uniref:Disease resistance protein RPM1 n=1 Tax=Aegilops tauschii subsp. strangulata TaxID=200361 RepID=A0A453GFP0_AEGTS|nr:disease resistance protein RPM1-like [Aegilops tauschii subsp. strangulata]XP_020194015.1 disease resistance protein RPM1-like [Aegilops tauschii subsp. strangulata]XP_020194016.1 disease resistance protein RPM1-like [Aegilops tauschii subsp. strangulata]